MVLQRHAHRHLDEAGVANLAGQREHLGSLALGGADAGEPFGPLVDDRGDVGERLDVVDERRAIPKPLLRGIGGTNLRHAALALDRFDQGGLFAADEGPGADAQVDAKIHGRIEDAGAQQPKLLRLLDGDLQAVNRERIFGADVDVALRGADGVGGNGHAFQHAVRIAFQNAAVHEGAGIAFVRVADDELARPRHLGDQAPLDAGRIARAAAPTQTAPGDRVNDLGRRHVPNRAMERLVAARRDVRFDPLRLDDAGIFQDDRHLLGEERLLGVAALEASRVAGVPRWRPAQRCDDRRHLFRRHLLKKLLRGIDLHQRPRTTEPQTADAARLHTVAQALCGYFAGRTLA